MYSVSIILPIYNNEKTLRQSIDSILNQSMYGIELILINDGSTDGSAEICNEYAKKEPLQVEVIHQEHLGEAVAKNVGLNHSSGMYVYFANPTVSYDKNLLRENVKLAIEKNADLVVFGFSTLNIKNENELSHHLPRQPFLSSKEQFRKHFRNFHHFFSYDLHNKLYLRSFLRKHYIKFMPDNRMHETFFNINIFKELESVAYNRTSYFLLDKTILKLNPDYHSNAFSDNIGFPKALETLFKHWGYEEYFKDIISKEYFNVLYHEVLKICLADKNSRYIETENNLFVFLETKEVLDITTKIDPVDLSNIIHILLFEDIKTKNVKRIIKMLTDKKTHHVKLKTVSRFIKRILK